MHLYWAVFTPTAAGLKISRDTSGDKGHGGKEKHMRDVTYQKKKTAFKKNFIQG